MNATSLAQQTLACAVMRARRTLVQIEHADPAWERLTELECYQIMFDVARQLEWPTLGWKIAGTNPGMQRQLRTSGAVYGRTFRRYHAASPARLQHSQLLDPIVESEFFFCMGRDLHPRASPYSAEEVADAVEAVYIGIEVAECRFSRHCLPGQNVLIADGFASGRYVQGARVANWRRALEEPVLVTVHRNGELRSSGSPRDVMGHPLNAVTWLANRLSSLAIPLHANELVSSGSCTGLVRARSQDRIDAQFGALGTVTIDFI